MFKDNWLSILSLVVAAAGGIPGIIIIINRFKSSSKLVVSPANFIFGNVRFNPDPIDYTLIFFSLTVTNEGEKPLSPGAFYLDIKKGRRWIKLEGRPIPEDINFPSKEQTIEVSEPWKNDLQRFSGAIPHGFPLLGFLYFVTDKIELNELRAMSEMKFRLRCTDIFGKRHKVTFTSSGKQSEKDIVYPKHGISIRTSKNA